MKKFSFFSLKNFYIEILFCLLQYNNTLCEHRFYVGLD